MADFRNCQKLCPRHEIGPVSFSESFVAAEVPHFIRQASDYTTLTWILAKACTVRHVQASTGADCWPVAETIVQNRTAILQSLHDFAQDHAAVRGYLDQHIDHCASIGVIRNSYEYHGYNTWIQNNGLEAEFDRAIHHYTGWRICTAV